MPPLRQRIALRLYRLLMWLALPAVLLYFRRRARKDPAYGRHMRERFGRGDPVPADAVWVRAVSLGEMRSAVPLVRAVLDRGEVVVTTHLTPAGRRAAEAAFGPEIAAGRLHPRYLPLETGPAWRRFLAHPPRLGLAMEIEIWPVMIAEAARAGVPLWLANSQIPERSFARARRWAPWIGHPVTGIAGVLAKSERMAARFRALGAPNVHVTGELRFDQPVPARLLAAAAALMAGPAGASLRARRVVTLASVVEGEDGLILGAIRSVQAGARSRGEAPPLFVYVPRAPERFAATGVALAAAGQKVLHRSRLFDADLRLTGDMSPGPGAGGPQAADPARAAAPFAPPDAPAASVSTASVSVAAASAASAVTSAAPDSVSASAAAASAAVSAATAPASSAAVALAEADILVGDSLGEMFFYLALADLVVVGGGFVAKGAHNVIEPLALRKPVLVGPQVWTIEYPGREAEAAGVLQLCADGPALARTIGDLFAAPADLAAMADRTEAFFAAHSGATARSLAVLAPWLAPAPGPAPGPGPASATPAAPAAPDPAAPARPPAAAAPAAGAGAGPGARPQTEPGTGAEPGTGTGFGTGTGTGTGTEPEPPLTDREAS